MSTSERSSVPVVFSGKAGEYFGIWMVNLTLTILTLGIYSAWAKVRTRRYFSQHTSIDGRRFDYHATGMQILIGRIIVVALFAALAILQFVGPLIYLAFTLVFMFVYPWLIVRGLRFNAAHSSWSNVRFRFHGGYPQALWLFLFAPLLVMLTLGLTYPLLARAYEGYIRNNHALGGNRFSFESDIWPFYRALLLAGAFAVVVIVGALALYEISGVEGSANFLGRLFFIVFLIAFVPAGFIYSAFIRNAVYAATKLEGGHEFRSNVVPLALVGIAVTNALAIVLSLGMLLPWARIRMARYMAEHTSVLPNGSLDEFVSELEEKQSAIGDAYTDIEGVDVGIGI